VPGPKSAGGSPGPPGPPGTGGPPKAKGNVPPLGSSASHWSGSTRSRAVNTVPASNQRLVRVAVGRLPGGTAAWSRNANAETPDNRTSAQAIPQSPRRAAVLGEDGPVEPVSSLGNLMDLTPRDQLGRPRRISTPPPSPVPFSPVSLIYGNPWRILPGSDKTGTGSRHVADDGRNLSLARLPVPVLASCGDRSTVPPFAVTLGPHDVLRAKRAEVVFFAGRFQRFALREVLFRKPTMHFPGTLLRLRKRADGRLEPQNLQVWATPEVADTVTAQTI
jgi:hypothetical protein